MSMTEERQAWALPILQALDTTIAILTDDRTVLSTNLPPDSFATIINDEINTELRNAIHGIQLVQERIRQYAIEGKV